MQKSLLPINASAAIILAITFLYRGLTVARSNPRVTVFSSENLIPLSISTRATTTLSLALRRAVTRLDFPQRPSPLIHFISRSPSLNDFFPIIRLVRRAKFHRLDQKLSCSVR